jgi:long-chain acyl-CoA synthetase
MLMYSSGTTGKPKGILLTNMNEMHICRSMPVGNVYQDDEVFLLLAPMFHVSPLCIYTYSSIYMGHSIVIRSMFSPTDFWPTVIKYGVTCVWGTPAMFAYVMYQVAAEDVDVSKVKIRHGSMGGAPVPLELIGEFEDKFGFTLSDGYGLTESCGFCATTDGRPYKHGSIGGCHGECEIEIMDDDNNILPYGEPGELCVRGGTVMLGYFNNPHATAETIKDNWLHTGDLAYMDEEAIFSLWQNQGDDQPGGENIYPREVEIPLEAHPKVAQVAVVGKPDPALGEKVKACIILKEGAVMTEQEVKDYLKEQIAKYKVPEFVQFYDTFPLNASGKILKSQLKD